MFKVPDREHTVYFDVDDTLVEWIHENYADEHPTAILGLQQNSKYAHVPIEAHIDKLKEHKDNGATIVVWTQGGSDWAEIVVKALGLEVYVDVCLTKPTTYYDDLHCEEFMPPRRYIGPGRLYK